MHKLVSLSFLVLISALAVPPTPALACSCAPLGSPEDSLASAAAVVEARAIAGPQAVSSGDEEEDGSVMLQGPVEYQFEVIRSWKGSLGQTLTVETASDSAACGRSYTLGASYVLYLHNVNGDRAHDGACSRTRSTKDAAEDLAFLGVDQGSDEGKASATPSPTAASTSETHGVIETTGSKPSSPKADKTTGGKRGRTEDKEVNLKDAEGDTAPTCAVSGHEAQSSLLLLLVLGVSLTVRHRN